MAKVNLYNEELESKKEERIALFSGGLDSVAMVHFWKPDYLLYCTIGHRYQERELAAISKMELSCPIIYDHSLNLCSWERRDAIIPLRNLFFTMVASRYGDRIAMGVLHGEVNGDKSIEFREQASKLMSLCYDKSYWCEGREIEIEYPISQWTKAELIKEYLDRGYPLESLTNSRSCYSEGDLPCGHCSCSFTFFCLCAWV